MGFSIFTLYFYTGTVRKINFSSGATNRAFNKSANINVVLDTTIEVTFNMSYFILFLLALPVIADMCSTVDECLFSERVYRLFVMSGLPVNRRANN